MFKLTCELHFIINPILQIREETQLMYLALLSSFTDYEYMSQM